MATHHCGDRAAGAVERKAGPPSVDPLLALVNVLWCRGCAIVVALVGPVVLHAVPAVLGVPLLHTVRGTAVGVHERVPRGIAGLHKPVPGSGQKMRVGIGRHLQAVVVAPQHRRGKVGLLARLAVDAHNGAAAGKPKVLPNDRDRRTAGAPAEARENAGDAHWPVHVPLAIVPQVGGIVVGRWLLLANVNGTVHGAARVPRLARRERDARKPRGLGPTVVAATNLDGRQVREHPEKVHYPRGTPCPRVDPSRVLIQHHRERPALVGQTVEHQRVPARGLENHVGRLCDLGRRGRLRVRQGKREPPIVGSREVPGKPVRRGQKVPRLRPAVGARHARSGIRHNTGRGGRAVLPHPLPPVRRASRVGARNHRAKPRPLRLRSGVGIE
mmetsp:Transcript_18973/g.36940  ORF Transcript_18973/g.36940 Transcript_18973/m.36940 type:complete len:385 (-) Transcript_18973:336-1490(-)